MPLVEPFTNSTGVRGPWTLVYNRVFRNFQCGKFSFGPLSVEIPLWYVHPALLLTQKAVYFDPKMARVCGRGLWVWLCNKRGGNSLFGGSTNNYYCLHMLSSAEGFFPASLKFCNFAHCFNALFSIQWNLRIKDTWGPEQVSFIQRCLLFGG